ncbi:MAG: O-methyltransferase [Lachnospiraceae bacterium]|nr:O-methyltransferase [Lachnospiraceae bacterium]
MDKERLDVYISTLMPPLPPALAAIERSARKEGIPILRKDSQNLLRLLIAMQQPERILEIGTAVGFSASVMALCDTNVNITTLELDETAAARAETNFKALGLSQRVTLIRGDAAETLRGLTGPFDFVFMDAAKGQYPVYFEEVKRLLSPGGLLVTDNCLQEGTLLESRFAVKRRDRTIHGRMREYLDTVFHDPDFVSNLIDSGDGVLVSKRIH